MLRALRTLVQSWTYNGIAELIVIPQLDGLQPNVPFEAPAEGEKSTRLAPWSEEPDLTKLRRGFPLPEGVLFGCCPLSRPAREQPKLRTAHASLAAVLVSPNAPIAELAAHLKDVGGTFPRGRRQLAQAPAPGGLHGTLGQHS